MGSNMAKCVFFEDLSGRFKISWAKDRFESGILVKKFLQSLIQTVSENIA